MDNLEVSQANIKLLDSYHAIFDTVDGEAVLEDLAQHCHANGTSAVAGDPHSTYFNEGKRAVYLYIKRKLKLREKATLANPIEEEIKS